MNRVRTVKLILWLITGFAAAVGLTRLIFGLGVTTNLTDSTPWGFWISFDVMAGVALAGGGFVLTAIFYMMRRDKYHDLVKPAVLTAFLGYIAVIIGLLFHVGLPWNLWHMMIYWNPHSPLFEVGWCVMLYTTVLLLEFSPTPLEEFSRYAKIRSILMKFRFPLVLLGIMLSTLHQSSLGSLFLIMPFKLHALWYSSILPIQFFLSAIALGLMMVSLESLVSHWLYRRKPENNLVAGLGKAAVYVLSTYFIVKMVDIIAAGELGLIFNGSWEGNLFISEMLISVLIPIVIFAIPRLRQKNGWQWLGSFLVVFGMVFNRINVGGLTMLRATGDSYVPSWMEFALSFGVVSAAGLVFLFAIERFKIWHKRPENPEADPLARPQFDYSARTWLGTPAIASTTRYSLAFILSFAIGIALMPDDRIHGEGVENIPVQKARGAETLFIDGNHDSFGVSFKHKTHIDSLGGSEACVKCHHMNLPLDKNSGCWQCHKNMYSTTDMFNHNWHNSEAGADIVCDKCHPVGSQRETGSAKKCNECHNDLIPGKQEALIDNFMAVSYVDALHIQCVDCHREMAADDTERAQLSECATCHETNPPEHLHDLLRWIDSKPSYNRVLLPEKKNQSKESKGI